ncbi:MAG: GNAT family N-acetyltransferase [Vagococcus sp.]|uniref:GNAT family N-acetyltransferase n=1 Tax=Vagococcus sp. TaxID=1933889 RepID=UPI002FC6550E
MKEELVLVKPTIDMIKEIEAYRLEFDTTINGIEGASLLAEYEDIGEWLDYLKKCENEETLLREDFVPAYQYMLVRKNDNKIIGFSHFRIKLNSFLLNYGGNIGYSIAPSERRKGYGEKMLAEVLKEAPKFNLDKLLLTCDESNLASMRVIEKNQGVLENKLFIEDKNKWIRRYWITIK